MYDLSGLSREERMALREAIDNHPDEEQDKEMFQPIVEALQYLSDKIDALEDAVKDVTEHVNRVDDAFTKDFLGGLEELYTTNERHNGIEAIRGKYGESFAPHEGYLKTLMPEDEDLYEKLFDHLKGRWDDEDFDPDDEMDRLLGELEDKISKTREALGAGGAKVSVKEIVKGPEGDEGDGDELDEDTLRELGRLKKMPGMRQAAGE